MTFLFSALLMRHLRLFAVCLGIAVCLMCRVNISAAEQPVPALTAHMMDLTGTLTTSQKAALEAKLAAFEQEKGAQIAVLILPTTQPETIEQYSMRVVEAWKLGRKGIDDGVLLLIAKNDRKMRIEVGYGLEGALSDAVSKRIISEVITPFFKREDFYGGIDAGINAMIKVISGEPLPQPSNLKAKRRSSSGSGVLPMLFMTVFFSAILGSVFLRSIFGRFFGGIFTFIAAAVLTWFILSSLIWAVIIGIIAMFMGMAMGGSGVGGVFYGGGFGGGGFSGGGGFGGGGASGDW